MKQLLKKIICYVLLCTLFISCKNQISSYKSLSFFFNDSTLDDKNTNAIILS